jgi:AbrB family looped-hinge helix DNA binding protein
MTKTKVTSKYQTTIPEDIRKELGIKAGGKVEWYMVRGFAIVDVPTKIKKPVDFLTSQTKLNIDAVKIVKESREDFR